MYNLKYVSTKNRAQTKIDVKNNFLSDSKLKVNELPNAVVASREMGGPGVFSDDEQYVIISDFTKSTDEIRKLKKSTIQFVNEEVVFIGTFYHSYGHILTDDLKHLWILLSENRLNKLKFVFVQYSNDSINEIFFEICEILGKPRNEIVQIKGAKRFSKVYIPDQCFFVKPGGNLDQSGYRYYTKEYKAIIERIKIAAPDTADVDKIYFTRTAFKKTAF